MDKTRGHLIDESEIWTLQAGGVYANYRGPLLSREAKRTPKLNRPWSVFYWP